MRSRIVEYFVMQILICDYWLAVLHMQTRERRSSDEECRKLPEEVHSSAGADRIEVWEGPKVVHRRVAVVHRRAFVYAKRDE